MELSVVLALVGLIAGGVLVGSSYLRTARITSTVNEIKSYFTAMQQFERISSGAPPGDMANATDFWSSAVNGNGNGRIDPEFNLTRVEPFQVFSQMQLAGLIAGNFTGRADPPASWSNATPGVNIPVLSLEGVSGYVYTAGFITGHGGYYDGNYGKLFEVGRVGGGMSIGGFLTPPEAYETDSKFDNGVPDSGWIRTYKSHADCVTGTVYNASTATPDACALLFITP